jgi:hypothetical protein
MKTPFQPNQNSPHHTYTTPRLNAPHPACHSTTFVTKTQLTWPALTHRSTQHLTPQNLTLPAAPQLTCPIRTYPRPTWPAAIKPILTNARLTYPAYSIDDPSSITDRKLSRSSIVFLKCCCCMTSR